MHLNLPLKCVIDELITPDSSVFTAIRRCHHSGIVVLEIDPITGWFVDALTVLETSLTDLWITHETSASCNFITDKAVDRMVAPGISACVITAFSHKEL